jgi:hypothetical protein
VNEHIEPVRLIPKFSVGVQLHETHDECVDQMIEDIDGMVSRLDKVYERFDRKYGDDMDSNHVRLPGDLFCKVFFEMQDMAEYLRWIRQQKGIPQFNYNSIERGETA